MKTIIKADPGWSVIGENYAPDDVVDHPGFWRQTIIAWEIITRELTGGSARRESTHVVPITVDGALPSAEFAIIEPRGAVTIPGIIEPNGLPSQDHEEFGSVDEYKAATLQLWPYRLQGLDS